MTHYTVYKITNLINQKFYIGIHKTENLNDGYMGSGKYLKYSQQKYGMENFSKEILFVFNTPEQMYSKEAEIVNENFISRKDTYNIKVGGDGGFDHINRDEPFRKLKNRKAYETMLRALKQRYDGDCPFKMIGKLGSHRRIQLYPDLSKQNAARGHREGWFTFAGKSHTQVSKDKISVANKISQSGYLNSQYGTRWIYSLTENLSLKIRKDEHIPDGWALGRKPKNAKVNPRPKKKTIGHTRAKASTDSVRIALLQNNLDIDEAMKVLGYKPNSFGNSRNRFIKIRDSILENH